jgi:hypothetical protein
MFYHLTPPQDSFAVDSGVHIALDFKSMLIRELQRVYVEAI